MHLPDQNTKAKRSDSTQTLVMDMDNEATTPSLKMKAATGSDEVEHSRLLSLPKELRLEIWSHVLTDPAIDKRILRICRKYPGPSTSSNRFSNSLRKSTHPTQHQIKTVFEEPRARPINVNLLKTNRLIYEEALPILYQSVKFCPWALGGFFPVFLREFSPFARSHIRYVKLYIRQQTYSDFSWAVTCAQVAKLNDSLRLVEVDGDWPLLASSNKQGRLLYPLLRIKAPKKFVGPHDAEFQELLTEASKELEAKALVRRAFTAADLVARAGRSEPPSKKQQLQEVVFRAKPAPVDFIHVTNEDHIAQSLSTISGIQNFEKDLEDWDMVSVRSASLSRKRVRTYSISDEETWVDGASTIVAKEDDDIRFKESEDWVLID